MNYYELTKIIENTSLQHPFINSFFTDRYSLIGGEDDIKYGVISLLNETHRIGSNVSVFNFKIIFADRLTDDNNKIQLQSVGIQAITEICNALRVKYDLDITEDLSIDLYEGQFADECAGAISSISILVRSDLGDCEWINTGKEIEC